MDLISLVVPAELGPMVTVSLLAASFVGSFITIAFGIGGGAFLLAVMATLMPPLALIPVHGIVQFGSNAGRAVLMIRHASWGNMGGFVLGSVVGVLAGAAIVVNIPPALVQAGVGFFIIWSVLSKPPAWLRRFSVLTGLISSFLTMFFGATGVFVANYTKSLNLGRHAHVATHATLMTVQHLLKTVAFGLLGFAFATWAGFAAAMIVAGLLGTFAGRAVLERLTDARFKTALDVILLLIAARLVWAGLTSL